VSNEAVGPVTGDEAAEVVTNLRAMAERAAEHHQSTFYFVLSMAAESLADNVETALEFQSDGTAHVE
jgi:hypothetical protein